MTKVKPLIKVNGKIDHDMIQQIFEGKKVVDELNDDDAEIIASAIHDKFKHKKEQIIEDLDLVDEEGRRGKLSFTIKTGTYNKFFHLRVKPRYEGWNRKKDDTPNTIISVYFNDGVTTTSGYGNTIQDITRVYKLTRIKNALEKIEGILDGFIEILKVERPQIISHFKEEKKQKAWLKRYDKQEKFRDIHQHYEDLQKIAGTYKVQFSKLEHLSALIVKRGKAELNKLKQSGTGFWKDDEDRKQYKFIEVFE